MAKTWYPVVDYGECVECGTCVSKCPHGVYDRSKAPSPVVANPVSCIDHCHGCGNWCPKGAITYVGDDTTWLPPHRNGTKQPDDRQASCCGSNGNLQQPDSPAACCGEEVKPDRPGMCDSGSPGANGKKPVVIDFMYLDLYTCERCKATDSSLDAAVRELSGLLGELGYPIVVNKQNITSLEMAEKYKFLSSPTIRVNGRDICTEVVESPCGDCGGLCGGDVVCRVFVYGGKEYDQPPKAMIIDGILKAIYGPKQSAKPESYVLPQNLRTFFDGRKNACCDGSCSCQDGCK